MTRDEADRIQEKWKNLGSPPCDHVMLVLESEKNYLSGSYICIRCGSVILPRQAS